MTPPAFQEGLTPFDREQRDKEKAEVMVDALEMEGEISANGAGSGLFVQNHDPGL